MPSPPLPLSFSVTFSLSLALSYILRRFLSRENEQHAAMRERENESRTEKHTRDRAWLGDREREQVRESKKERGREKPARVCVQVLSFRVKNKEKERKIFAAAVVIFKKFTLGKYLVVVGQSYFLPLSDYVRGLPTYLPTYLLLLDMCNVNEKTFIRSFSFVRLFTDLNFPSSQITF